MVVRGSLLWGPSACSLFWCRCGTKWSIAKRKRMPIQKPSATGKNDQTPSPAASSSAGMSKLQMDAATITPEANPVNARCSRSLSACFMPNTQAEPRTVPRSGKSKPYTVCKIIFQTSRRHKSVPVLESSGTCTLFADGFFTFACCHYTIWRSGCGNQILCRQRILRFGRRPHKIRLQSVD